MSRIIRVLAPVAALAALALPPAPAQAVSTLAFTFAVPCDAPNGADSLGLTLPSGWYAVTIAGACSWAGGSVSMSAGTPCSVPTVGTVPCSSTTIDNVPSRTCYWSLGGITTRCAVPTGTAGCAEYSVQVSSGCVDGPAGVVYHPGGTMSAKFIDGGPGDNIGAFLVTVVWTPL